MPDFHGLCELEVENDKPELVRLVPITATSQRDALQKLADHAEAQGIDCNILRVVQISDEPPFVLSESKLDGPDKI